MLRYAITIFLGAFLLLLVQPLIARYILPWFGGGPGVWTVCLLFFQSALLIGYAYAHAINHALKLRTQAMLHASVVSLGVLLLPVIPSDAWQPHETGDPTLRILLLLAATIGLPYMALAATSPLMQAWFSRTNPNRSPYRLFALSNAGSLGALLVYPLVFDPFTTRVEQGWIWSAGFAIFAVATLYCSVKTLHATRHATGATTFESDEVIRKADDGRRAPLVTVLLWIVLPACASVLLLTFTTRLSEEIAPMPLVWVLPLAAYLLSFILAFEWPRLYHRAVFLPLYLLSLALVSIVLLKQREGQILLQTGGVVLALFTCCMICHGEAYRLRPHPTRLTGFYLAIAFGGALGGACTAIAAPRLFNTHLEFYIALFSTFVLMMFCLLRDSAITLPRWAMRGAAMVAAAAVIAAACVMTWQHRTVHEATVWRARNFFGVLSIKEMQARDEPDLVYGLYHGRIIHGLQIMMDKFRRHPTAYYGTSTAVGLVMHNHRPNQWRHIGAVGLGTGTLAAYMEQDDRLRFYEIDTKVIALAREVFTFISDAEDRGAEVQIVVGDARLSMEREAPQNFDVLILDAFSGDSVPVHLLTREAFEVYQRHLAADGVILAHVSNLHLKLHQPLMRLAKELQWESRFITNEEDSEKWIYGSHWVLLTRNSGFVQQPAIQAAARPVEGAENFDLWTDEHASLLRILK